MKIRMWYNSVTVDENHGNYSFEVEVDDEKAKKIEEIVADFDRKENNYKRKMRYNHVLSLDGLDFDVVAAQDEPVSFLLERLTTEAAMGRLTDVQRRRLGMEICGMERKEIAAAEEVSAAAVSESIVTARKSMKLLLAED